MADYYLGCWTEEMTERQFDDEHEPTREDLYECPSISITEEEAKQIQGEFTATFIKSNSSMVRKLENVLNNKSKNYADIVDFFEDNATVFVYDKSEPESFLEKLKDKVGDIL